MTGAFIPERPFILSGLPGAAPEPAPARMAKRASVKVRARLNGSGFVVPSLEARQ